MGTLKSLLKELIDQEPEESVGDIEEFGLQASIVRGNLVEVANDLGYDVHPLLEERLAALAGAIVFAHDDNVNVETFFNDEDLTNRWDHLAAVVEAHIAGQELIEE